jgi:flagellar hook assembly protein FlgD
MSVRLAVYDVAGRRRAVLVDGEVPAGVTEVTWNGQGPGGERVASGVYFARLTYGGGAMVSKVVMLH